MNQTFRIIKRTGPGLQVLDIFNGEKKMLPWEFVDALKAAGRLPKNAALVKGRIVTVLEEAK